MLTVQQCLRPLFLAATLSAVPANAQVVSFQHFETTQDQWFANGVETLVNDGQGISGQYLKLPFMDFFGLTLSTENASTGLLGDLTRYPRGLRVSFDIRTFRFENFNGDPIDTNSRPMVLHLKDVGDPDDFTDDAGIWLQGLPIPTTEEGWQRREFFIPFPPAGGGLPAGWQGSGGEDPVTFEPILPPGRTYANVLASIDRVEATTFVPGFFYGFTFWEMGIDNVRVEQPPVPTCPCDWNEQSGLTVQDIFDFLAGYFSNDGDFNGLDGTTVQDIFDFLACYFGGC